MVVDAIMKPPSFEGGRRFVLRAMVQTKRQTLNFADPVVQKQQMILKSLPGVFDGISFLHFCLVRSTDFAIYLLQMDSIKFLFL